MYQECEAVMNRLLSLRRELSGDKSKQAKNVMYQIDRFEDEWGNIVIKSNLYGIKIRTGPILVDFIQI